MWSPARVKSGKEKSSRYHNLREIAKYMKQGTMVSITKNPINLSKWLDPMLQILVSFIKKKREIVVWCDATKSGGISKKKWKNNKQNTEENQKNIYMKHT